MALSPALHPLNVFRPAKVRTILWLIEPLGLGSSLAGLATLGFCAVALSVSTIRAGNKELSAMEALARRRRVHGEAHNTASPQRRTQAPRYPSLIQNKNRSRRRTFVSKIEEENTGIRKKIILAIQTVLVQTCRIRPISGRSPHLAVRPIFHQLEKRIEAHIFVAFLAFCLHATLRHKLRLRAPGLTPRSVLEQLSAIQMLDVHFPTTDGRWLIFCRYTSPNKIQKLLIGQLALELPAQAPPQNHIPSPTIIETLPSQTRL
jgi:hypothetical protein